MSRCPYCSFDPTSMNDYCDEHRPTQTPAAEALPPLPDGWTFDGDGWSDGGGLFVSATANGVDVEGVILLTSPREHADLLIVLRHAQAAQARLKEGGQ